MGEISRGEGPERGSEKHLHLGSRLHKQLEGDMEVWAMQGH